METLFIGKNLLFLHDVESTNTYAMNLLRNVNVIEGTVIHTDNQTNGRGQRGSLWASNIAQNITSSIILKPTFLGIDNTFYLSKISALAVYDVLTDILPNSQYDIKIKWPNDILVNRRKIAGILIETTIQNNLLNCCVAGFGINVNQTHFGDLQKATSLKLLSHKEFLPTDVLKTLCRYVEKYYLALINSNYEEINQNYLKHFFGLNEFLNFELRGEFKNLMVKGLTNSGLILLEDNKGKHYEADVKELKWVY